MITIYSTTWCPPCHALKAYLDSLGIAYTVKDIEADPEAALEAVTKSGERAVPIIDIDGEIIVGFDRPRVDDALASHPQN